MVAFYLRLSMSDGDLGVDNKDESNSIENQRLLLQNYLQDREDIPGEIKEYIDDGYSGTNFNRPAFKTLIDDCKKGLIDTVLVKDLSRLGRNYIEVGDYVEQMFPMLGIRFIVVNQNYDSKDYAGEGMDFAMHISNLVSSLYSRDLSKKIRSAKKIKRKNGISTAAMAPFGYIKDPERRGAWKLDPEAAKVVRLIFEKAIDGYKTIDIAEYLNEHGIDTPYVYNRRTKQFGNLNTVKTKESEMLWNRQKVVNVLNRYEYTGAFVEGRRSPVTVGSSRVRKKDESEWSIIDGVNEPIVSREEYEIARRVLKPRRSPDYIIQRNYPLKGKVKCGNCRLSMSYTDITYQSTFHCDHKKSTGRHSKCSEDMISSGHLEQVVYLALRDICYVIGWAGEQIEGKREAEMKKLKESDLGELEKQIVFLKNEKIRMYEQYADGHVSKEVYLHNKKEVSKKLEQAITSREELLGKQIQKNNEYLEFQEHVDRAEEFLGESALTREMVEYFIDVIYVYDAEHVDVIFNFEDEIRKIMDEFSEDNPFGQIV